MMLALLLLVIGALQMALFIRAIASWLPQPSNEAVLKVCHICYKMTEPMLKVARKHVKDIQMDIGGQTVNISMSFMACFLALMVAQIFAQLFFGPFF